MDKVIQFIANYDEWQAVRKIKITEKTTPKDIMEFLSMLTVSVDNKIEQQLRMIVELNKVDSFIKENIEKGKSIELIAKALNLLESRNFSKLLNELTGKIENKNDQKEIKSFIKLYAIRKTLNMLGLNVDYSII